jgi:hypothetical protein
MKKDNNLIKKIYKKERRARIKREIKELTKESPYQLYIILFGVLFLIWYLSVML